jgi:antitoxin HicB
MSTKPKNRKSYTGSSIDDFLKQEGIFKAAQTQAIKEVVAWQLAQPLKNQKISKNTMAALSKTGRTQAGRLLNLKSDLTLCTLQRATDTLHQRVGIKLT